MNALLSCAVLMAAVGLAQNPADDDNDDNDAQAAQAIRQNAQAQGPAPAAAKGAAKDPLAPPAPGDQAAPAPGAPNKNEIHVHHHHHYYGPPASPYINTPPPSDPSLQPYPQVGGGGYGRGYGGGGGGWGGWGGGGWGGGTIAGSYLQGLGAAAAGAGQYNLATAEANRQAEAAYSAYLQNQMTALNDYFMAHEANRAYRETMHGPPLSPEQIYDLNRSRLPKRLRLEQFDPVTGKINWPDVLKAPQLDGDRQQLQALFANRTHENSGVGSENYHDVQMVVHDMMAKLHDEIKTLSPAEYLLALNFVDGLSFEARFPPSSVPGGVPSAAPPAAGPAKSLSQPAAPAGPQAAPGLSQRPAANP